MNPPAQKTIVDRFLNWDRVRERLSRFPAIRTHYPESVLRSCSDTPPYFCHYLAWRLGTWSNEGLFARFDELLNSAATLPHWEEEFPPLRTSCDFETFWSLQWQLQTAHFFSHHGATTSWNPAGPDLLIRDGTSSFFVECYSYRKSFGLELYIEEMLRQVDRNLRVEHDWCLPFSLPKDRDRSAFFDALMAPVLEDSFLDSKRRDAKVAWPVALPVPPGTSGFRLVLQGDDPDACDPPTSTMVTGDPDRYLEVVLREVVRAKHDSNSLQASRPNVLAVNCLLSPDFALAEDRHRDLQTVIPSVNFGTALDAVLVTDCGIDETFFFRLYEAKDESHPFTAWLRTKGVPSPPQRSLDGLMKQEG